MFPTRIRASDPSGEISRISRMFGAGSTSAITDAECAPGLTTQIRGRPASQVDPAGLAEAVEAVAVDGLGAPCRCAPARCRSRRARDSMTAWRTALLRAHSDEGWRARCWPLAWEGAWCWRPAWERARRPDRSAAYSAIGGMLQTQDHAARERRREHRGDREHADPAPARSRARGRGNGDRDRGECRSKGRRSCLVIRDLAVVPGAQTAF